ncbi:MAG: hypothetical protein IJ148_07135 [Bacteroidaceae bacterium]|nr:hypothetical protein [Bacteroidaceae bacterium]
MKTIIKCLFILLATSASAQNRTLEELPSKLQKEYGLTLKKSINQERDILREDRPLKSRADIYAFVLTAKQREKILPTLQEAFEKAGKDDPNCYSVNTMNDLTGKESLRNLMIGDNPEQYITIGQDYNNYVNVNFLDAEDSTKTHRYAYALEWREMQNTSEKGSLEVRYVVTYAKIPKPQISVKYHASTKVSDLQGYDFTADDLLCNDNILLLFDQLKEKYESGKNKTFDAISIYLLCKRARNYGFFTDARSQKELDQFKDEVITLYNKETDPACDYYLKLALEELGKIQTK